MSGDRQPTSGAARHRALLTALVVASGAGGTVVSWSVAQHSLIGARWTLLVLMAAWAPAWVVGAVAATRLGTRRSLLLVVAFAALLRVAALSGTTPSISNDVYRYGWDAHIQLSGIDPYRYPPDARALVPLRDGFWPDAATCVHIRKKPGCSVLNRLGDRTIYPAAGEAWFALVHLLNPGDAGSRPWLVTGALVDLGCVLAIAAILRRRGRDPRLVAWYALSPLPVVELAGNGHVDGVALLAVLAAFLALERRWRVVAGALVAFATMTKLYPAAALLAWICAGGRRMIVAAAVVAIAFEAPHIADVGPKVLGYLPGYLKEERYTTGARFLLVDLLDVHGRVATGLAVAIVVAVAVAVVATRREALSGLVSILVALILVTTPVQPWYAVVVGALGVAAGRPWLLALAAAAEPYYAATVLADHHVIGIGRASYGAAALICLAGAIRSLPARSRSSRGTTGQSIPYGSPP